MSLFPLREVKEVYYGSYLDGAKLLSSKFDKFAKESFTEHNENSEEISKGDNSWKPDNSAAFREFWKPLYLKTIGTILPPIPTEISSAAELASGFLVDGKNSFLASRMPAAIQEKTTFTI